MQGNRISQIMEYGLKEDWSFSMDLSKVILIKKSFVCRICKPLEPPTNGMFQKSQSVQQLAPVLLPPCSIQTTAGQDVASISPVQMN